VLDTVLCELAPGLQSAELQRHIADCPFCRIRFRRITATRGPRADVDAIARAIPSAPRVPASVVEVLDGGRRGAPAPQEMWLTVEPLVSMVWIRRIVDSSALVQSVVFDIEMADEHTLVLPAGATPFGVPLAVMCSFDAQVDVDRLDRRLFELPVGPSVEALRAARRSGTTTPPDITVGPPVEDGADERHEFRQIVADRIAAIAAPEEDEDLDPESTEFDAKIEHLRTRRPHCRLLPCGDVVDGKAEACGWRALVIVREIGATVVVLHGSLDAASAFAAREILELASATAIAFTEELDGSETRVFEPDDFAELRYAVPSGVRLNVDTHISSLDVVDALFKYLDATALFDDDVDLRADDAEVSQDLAEIARSEAAAAVTAARGRRYQRLTGEAFKALSDDDARFIAGIVEAGAAGEAVLETLHAYSRGR
jgi:hypothetical protein